VHGVGLLYKHKNIFSLQPYDYTSIQYQLYCDQQNPTYGGNGSTIDIHTTVDE
jgi:hypothetical protein